jgi:hypothetical protein
MERIVASLKRQGLHRPTDYCGWPAGAREASMALIPKRASASRHRCHNDPAILRYALKGTSKPRHVPSFLLVVTRTAGLISSPTTLSAIQAMNWKTHHAARPNWDLGLSAGLSPSPGNIRGEYR